VSIASAAGPGRLLEDPKLHVLSPTKPHVLFPKKPHVLFLNSSCVTALFRWSGLLRQASPTYGPGSPFHQPVRIPAPEAACPDPISRSVLLFPW